MRARIRSIIAYVLSTRVWLFAHPASLGVVIGALLSGSLAGLPAGDTMFRYMWADPRFCDDCHVHDYANQAWERSVHGQLTTCHDCHRVPIRHYPKNLVLALFDRPAGPDDIPRPEVTMVICEQCHSVSGAEEPLTGPMPEELRVQVVRVDDSPLHKLHLNAKSRVPSLYQGGKPDEVHTAATGEGEAEAHGEAASDKIECLDCHGGLHLKVHRFTATPDACESCHKGITPSDESGRSLSCLDCHARGFLGNTELEAAR